MEQISLFTGVAKLLLDIVKQVRELIKEGKIQAEDAMTYIFRLYVAMDELSKSCLRMINIVKEPYRYEAAHNAVVREFFNDIAPLIRMLHDNKTAFGIYYPKFDEMRAILMYMDWRAVNHIENSYSIHLEVGVNKLLREQAHVSNTIRALLRIPPDPREVTALRSLREALIQLSEALDASKKLVSEIIKDNWDLKELPVKKRIR